MSLRLITGKRSEMTGIEQNAPLDEQKICVECGLCCDGTLFQHAHLDPGESGGLPARLEENSYSKDGKDYFRLPCHYFDGKCTIYDQKKANVCSGYRCQLLKDFAEEKITLDDALAVVSEALNMRDQILEQYRMFSGHSSKVYFKELLRKMGKIQDSFADGAPAEPAFDMLLAWCNIFEALLIKHFSPAGEFEKMIMK